MLALITETDTANLYSFLRNEPLDDLDLLGLCECNCGDDVTLAIALTEMDVDRAYSSAPYLKKVAANFNMFTFPMSLSTWDIKWVLGYPSPINSPPCPRCENTVTLPEDVSTPGTLTTCCLDGGCS